MNLEIYFLTTKKTKKIKPMVWGENEAICIFLPKLTLLLKLEMSDKQTVKILANIFQDLA